MADHAGALALLTLSIEQRLDRGYAQVAALSDAVLGIDRMPCCGDADCRELREQVSGVLARMVVGLEDSKCVWYGHLLPELRRIVSELQAD